MVFSSIWNTRVNTYIFRVTEFNKKKNRIIEK